MYCRGKLFASLLEIVLVVLSFRITMHSTQCNRRFLVLCCAVLFLVQIAIATIEKSYFSTSDGDDYEDSTVTRTTPSTTDAAICNTVECINQQLQSRLNTIESAFRMLLVSISSQTNDLFTPVKEMIARDPSVILILSETQNFINSSTFSASNQSQSKASFEQGYAHGNKDETSFQENIAVVNLKGAVKCSLADFVDISTIDINSSLNQASKIVASLNNESLEITWPIQKVDCLKFSSGVWIRVYQSGDEYKLPVETSLYIPQKCLEKKSITLHSISLSPPSPSPTSAVNKDTCLFSLASNLIQCRAYVVEVIPNYQSLRGKTQRTEIVVPPKQNNESSKKSLISVVAQSNSVMFNWEDNSGCAPQLTSFNLKIFQDGIVGDDDKDNMTITIPRSCLKRSTNDETLFSLVLPEKKLACPIEWKPLDRCRKYKFDMSSQYSTTWNGPSSSLEIFTGQEVAANPMTTGKTDYLLRCPKQHYWCSHHCIHITNYVCDGGNHCYSGADEEYCDHTLCNKDGFKCGKQCVPKELVCDGKYDCLDGSDEVDCSNTSSCEQLTNPSGYISSTVLSKPATGIHSDRYSEPVRKTIILISVQPNHQIWLKFDKFNTFQNRDFLEIYDGPYSTSPLLLYHSGSKIPPSIRSSSNELFVEFPSHYYDLEYGIEAYYTSIVEIAEPFVPGCGGYIIGDGIISSPNYLSNAGVIDCFWFIEARNSEDTILLRRNSSYTPILTAALSHQVQPPLTVYDGWNTDGFVLYDENATNIVQDEAVIYSFTNKMMIHFQPPKIKENHVFYWETFTISTPKCKKHFEGTSGTIKSPNYPSHYSHLTDCRWSISLTPGSKVRLLFAFFETQDGADFVSVYDGSTVHSKLLLTKSGSVPTPFVINSSTNQVLVRFTSDGYTSLPGFLAVYSSV